MAAEESHQELDVELICENLHFLCLSTRNMPQILKILQKKEFGGMMGFEAEQIDTGKTPYEKNGKLYDYVMKKGLRFEQIEGFLLQSANKGIVNRLRKFKSGGNGNCDDVDENEDGEEVDSPALLTAVEKGNEPLPPPPPTHQTVNIHGSGYIVLGGQLTGGQTFNAQPVPTPSTTATSLPAPPLSTSASKETSSLCEAFDGVDLGETFLLLEKGAPVKEAHSIVLIININLYTGKDMTREGSLNDVEKCVDTFSKFGFAILVANTQDKMVKHAHIKKWIEDFKKKFEGPEEDGVNSSSTNSTSSIEKKACFVIVMGHGQPGTLGDSNHNYEDIETNILTPFNNINFPQMKGKPKIFFMNCCRGSKRAVPQNNANDGPLADDGCNEDEDGKEAHVADMFIFWSTVPGYTATRHKKEGTVFIQTLCNGLAKYAEKLGGDRPVPEEDFERLMRNIAQAVERKRESTKNVQTTASENRTFRTFKLGLKGCTYEKDAIFYLDDI